MEGDSHTTELHLRLTEFCFETGSSGVAQADFELSPPA